MTWEGLCVLTKPGKKSVYTALSEVLVLGHASRVCVLPKKAAAYPFFLDFNFIFIYLFIYLSIHGCVGSSFLCEGFL